jgi:hypothetical protein
MKLIDFSLWFNRSIQVFKGSRPFNGEKTVFSTNRAGITGVYMQKNEVGPLPHTISSKWIKVLNIGAQTVKLLEENTSINLHDHGLGNSFLDMTTKEKQKET